MPSKAKPNPPIAPRQRVSDAFVAILRHNLAILPLWMDSARDWQDIEGVHQLRVVFRRMRSALSLFRDAIPRELTVEVADEMRWLADALGPARDLDVFIAEGLDVAAGSLNLAGESGLRDLAEQRRADCYRAQVCPMLDSPRLRRFLETFPDWLDTRPWESACHDARATERMRANILDYAQRRLDKQYRRVLKAGARVDREDAAEMHRLRIECKKLRYAAEFFLPLFSDLDDFIGHLKGIQDLLGVMNDVSVTRHLLDDLLSDTHDRQIILYAGALIGWRTCEYRHLLRRFDAAWSELVEARRAWREDAPRRDED